MKQSVRHICTRCKLTSADGNLWCQEIDCPAGTLPLLLKQGDQISNIRIDRLLRVLKTSTLYRVEIDDEKYLMKIANPGRENEDYLKKEASVIKLIHDELGDQYSAIPSFVMHQEFNDTQPYGVTTFHDFNNPTVYYFLMENIEGDFLYDYLTHNPQPYHEHVGYFMLTLTEGIRTLHLVNRLRGSDIPLMHLNLTPDTIIVVKNNLGIIQPKLIDLGLLLAPDDVSNNMTISDIIERFERYLQPAYFPPTLLKRGRERQVSPVDDVYGLGLIYHEMLRGEPTYPSVLIPTTDIYSAIRQNSVQHPTRNSEKVYDEIPPISRIDLPNRSKVAEFKGETIESIQQIVHQSVGINGARQYQTVQDLYNAIYKVYGAVPDREPNDTTTLINRIKRYAINSAALIVILSLFSSLLLAVLITVLSQIEI